MATALVMQPPGAASSRFVGRPAAPGVFVWRCTPAEFYKLGEFGMFQDRDVQLLDGVIVEMPIQNPLHTLGIALLEQALRAAFGDQYWVRNQSPIDLLPHSVPYPDVAVVTGDIRSHFGRPGHPTTALLVAESSDSTLREDRTYKASLYAAGGLSEYWILNIPDNVLEVFRDPRPDAAADFGFCYDSHTTLRAGDTVSPLAAQHAVIAVADILPG